MDGHNTNTIKGLWFESHSPSCSIELDRELVSFVDGPCWLRTWHNTLHLYNRTQLHGRLYLLFSWSVYIEFSGWTALCQSPLLQIYSKPTCRALPFMCTTTGGCVIIIKHLYKQPSHIRTLDSTPPNFLLHYHTSLLLMNRLPRVLLSFSRLSFHLFFPLMETLHYTCLLHLS